MRLLALRVGSKDACHVGDFIVGQCSSRCFSVHNLQSCKHIIQIKIRIITPSEWCQFPFTASVKLTNLFCDISGQPYEDKILQIRSISFYYNATQHLHLLLVEEINDLSSQVHVWTRVKPSLSGDTLASRLYFLFAAF